MLVLSRKLHQVIRVYDQAGKLVSSITVVDIDRGKIRLGIDAPKDYAVLREEIDQHFSPKIQEVNHATQANT